MLGHVFPLLQAGDSLSLRMKINRGDAVPSPKRCGSPRNPANRSRAEPRLTCGPTTAYRRFPHLSKRPTFCLGVCLMSGNRSRWTFLVALAGWSLSAAVAQAQLYEKKAAKTE